MPLIGAEAAAASLAAFLSSAILCAYLTDRIGIAIAPFAILAVAAAIAAAIWLWLRSHAASDPPAFAGFALIAAGTFGWLMFRARPDFLPTGTGSDLAHHLALLGYIEQHWRLVHDAAMGAYLGEMIDYTPGAHLLTAMAGAWLRRDALHVVHAVVSLTVALKCGLVFLIARRLMPDGVPRVPFAAVAVLLLWLPYVFFAGSFMEQSFLSQVVSELFAVAMWWALVVWDETPSAELLALFGLFGVAAFLTWPLWIGPLVLTLAAIVLLHRERSWKQRLQDLTIAVGPIALVAAAYALQRKVYGFDMVHAVGFAVWPTPRTLTWPFIFLSVPAFVWSLRRARTRIAAVLFLAVLLQAAALIVTGLNSGATTPYLTLKMAYLAIYPLAVSGAVLMAMAWGEVMRSPADTPRWVWLTVIASTLGVLVQALHTVAYPPAHKPVVTQPVFLAGDWARTHVPPACVDYLVADGYTGYWLHLAVLGNPRAAGRALENDTFEPSKAIVRWILPAGLPYAIAGDFDALPRDIRTSVDVLARFGPAAVVQRRGSATCADQK